MSNQEISKYDALNQPAENKQQQAYQQIKQDILNKYNDLAVDAMEIALRNMEKSLNEHDIFQCTRWDQKFHELLIGYAGNKRLETIYDQLDCQQMLFISTILDDTERASQSFAEHSAILAAIKEKDVQIAQDCIRKHYYHIKQYYINKLLSRIHI